MLLCVGLLLKMGQHSFEEQLGCNLHFWRLQLSNIFRIFKSHKSRKHNSYSFLPELHHLTSSLSSSHDNGVLVDIFHKHNIQVDRAILGGHDHLSLQRQSFGPLSSAYQCKQGTFYNEYSISNTKHTEY